MRLNRYISLSGLCSRRKADELIESGKVKINGNLVNDFAYQVSPRDKVEVDGKILKIEEKEYVIFNKPSGYITTRSDEKNRKTIYDLLPPTMKNLKPVGRLDKDSSGLLILTNDGDLINHFTHPSKKIAKIYLVSAEGVLSKNDIGRLFNGIEIEEGKLAKAEVEVLNFTNKKTEMKITLYQGYNRQIRRMMDSIGHPVLSLKRISHGPVQLGKLEKGEFRVMKKSEIRNLLGYLER